MTKILSHRWTVGLLVLGILLVAFAADRAWAWRSEVSAQHQREAAVRAASAEVTRLISVSDKNSAATLQALLHGGTASFRTDLQQDAKELQQALTSEKVVATGTVVSAGIGASTSRTATVFVAAEGTVSNTGTSGPQSREYRLQVSMQRVGSAWLVSNLVFVS